MLIQFHRVLMCLRNTKLIYLPAFEQFWASTVHKLLTQRRSSEYSTSVRLCD